MIYLFTGCFLSATILPFASEGFIIYALIKGYSPFWCFVSASAGNCLGSTVTYFTGVFCNNYVIKRFFPVNRNSPAMKKAIERLHRYKSPVLLLSWIPAIGDPIVLASGLIGIRLRDFMFYTYTGRLVRYLVMIFGFIWIW
ncbi:MAG TPA: VTT domain-containing protein [Candidatus Eremiobacteraeota bacterium]|nr:VTT domain-containing protein [Candidatus Eremiobacteraeota bacterium]